MYEAIERLRKLLMEHGIEYETAYISDDTYWTVNDIRWHAFESGGNTIWITCNSDVDLTPEQVIAITLGEERSCASCPEMDNPDSYIFHLMKALEHERGCCRDCKHSHMTSDGKHCKWCSVLATHEIDDEGYCDPPNGYNPEPYFDADFYCGFFERRVGGSCAACPEMDNPDSYIFHPMRALEHEKNTCKNVAEPPSDGGFWPAPHFECSKCGHKHVSMSYVYYCPSCGAKVVDE